MRATRSAFAAAAAPTARTMRSTSSCDARRNASAAAFARATRSRASCTLRRSASSAPGAPVRDATSATSPRAPGLAVQRPERAQELIAAGAGDVASLDGKTGDVARQRAELDDARPFEPLAVVPIVDPGRVAHPGRVVLVALDRVEL